MSLRSEAIFLVLISLLLAVTPCALSFLAVLAGGSTWLGPRLPGAPTPFLEVIEGEQGWHWAHGIGESWLDYQFETEDVSMFRGRISI